MAAFNSWAAPAKRVVEAHQAAPQIGVVGLIERTHAGNLVNRALLQMVLQISPDARPIDHAGDAKRSQPLRRADAGAVQDLRRSNRAGAQDHFAFAAGLERLSIPREQDADGAAVLDDEAIDQDVLL